MRRFFQEVRRRAGGAVRSFRATRARGGSVVRGLRNSVRYAATGAGRGG